MALLRVNVDSEHDTEQHTN